YLSSADAMTRNMIKRVEILFPIENKSIAKRLLDYLQLQLSDNQKGRYQDQYGNYHYINNSASPLNSQAYLMKEATECGLEFKNEITQPLGLPVNSKHSW
ncbi:RNA degradosome polyphosphate kinase, partial [Enterobacter mori]